MFKYEEPTAAKPNEFDPASYLSSRVASRRPPPWVVAYPDDVEKHPDPISLGGGMPNHGFFPVKSIDVNLKEGPFGKQIANQYQVVAVDDKTVDLKNGLQYANPFGLAQPLAFVKSLVAKLNPPAYKDYDITLSSGNGNSINKILDTIIDEGEVVLADQFNYSPIIQHVNNFKARLVTLKVKDGKTDIEYLTNLLHNWSTVYPEYPKPKAFYTIPNGSNPFGVVLSLEEKKQIYALAEKHDFILIEDDPYGYIQLPKYTGEPPKSDTVEEFTKNIAPSYLQLDTSGRVFRIETFSKVFAPGLRLGFIVGHKRFITSIMLYSFVVTGQLAAGPSQILWSNTVHKLGGLDGYIEWVYKVRNVYVDRLYKTLQILYDSKAYKEGKFTVLEPEAGMFLTIFFKEDLDKFIIKTIENGVAVVKGTSMNLGALGIKEAEDESYNRFIRITYAALTDDDLTEALTRLVDSIDQSF